MSWQVIENFDYDSARAKKIDDFGDMAYRLGERVIFFSHSNVMVTLTNGKGHDGMDLPKLARTYSDWLTKQSKRKKVHNKPDAGDGK